MKEYFSKGINEIPTIGQYDVVVAGAGPSGLCAAIVASRMGAKTIIIDKFGFAGGTSTISCCPYIMGFGAENRQIIGGIAEEFVRNLDKMGQAKLNSLIQDEPVIPISDTPLIGNVVTSIESIRITANRMLTEAKVKKQFYTSLIGAIAEDDKITHAVVDTIEGIKLIKGKYFIDATGNAELVHRAGGETRDFPEDKNLAKTILIRVGGVKEASKKLISEEYNKLYKNDDVLLGTQDRFMGTALLNPGEFLINYTMTSGNALNSDDLISMDEELREQALKTVEWFKSKMSAFSDCYLIDTAVNVGVRASRGIVGIETITMKDILSGSLVKEPICLSTTHFGGHYLNGFKAPWASTKTGIRPIPYRALVSKSFSNVLASGRDISCEPEVVDTIRLMARCMATGQAAGTAAAIAARENLNLSDVKYEKLREELLIRGVILEF